MIEYYLSGYERKLYNFFVIKTLWVKRLYNALSQVHAMTAVSDVTWNRERENWDLRLCHTLRSFQNQTSCSNRLLKRMVKQFTPFFKKAPPRSFKRADRHMWDAAGVKVVELNGCTGCDHIFVPADLRETCPNCGSERFFNDGRSDLCVIAHLV